MTKRSGGRWVFAALLIAVGCGGSDTGGTTRGPNGLPLPQAGKGSSSAGSSGGAVIPIDNPNATGPTQSHTMPTMVEMPCASTSIVANRVLPTVMLVVDGSTSMDSPYGDPPPDAGMPNGGGMPAAGQATRWTAIRDALVKPDVGVVPSLQGLVRFGLALFGTQPTCPLPLGVIPPDLNNYTKINAGLPNGTPPGFFTPTGPALEQVVPMLEDPTLAVDRVIGPQIIVLATDGDPNSCGSTDIFAGPPVTDYAPSIAAAMKIAQKHVKMYVISVGMDAAAQHLQEMANIGAGLAQNANPGATVYYPEDPAALAETLKTLIGAELSCDLALEGKGVKMGLECMGTVMLNGQALECNGDNGWQLVDETHIRLKGTACDTFKDAVDAKLSANFPCQVIQTI